MGFAKSSTHPTARPVSSTRLEIPQRRRHHLKAVADRAAGVAAEPRDGVELFRVDAHPLDIDDIALVVREDDFPEDDLTRLAELQRDVAAAFERRRRLL